MLIAQSQGDITNPILENLMGFSGPDFFSGLISSIVAFGFILGVIVGVLTLLFGSLQFITSGGDKAKIEAAKEKIFYALIGLVILFSLYALLRIIGSIFGLNLIEFDLSILQLGSSTSSSGSPNPAPNPLPNPTSPPASTPPPRSTPGDGIPTVPAI